MSTIDTPTINIHAEMVAMVRRAENYALTTTTPEALAHFYAVCDEFRAFLREMLMAG